MMIKRMTMFALATTICLSVASAQLWRTQPIMHTLRTSEMVKDMAVSPTGNQIAWVNANGVSIHKLRDGGGFGDLVRRVELPDLRKAVFVPSGNQIICAGGGGNVYMINRETWNVRTVTVPDGTFPAGIDVVTQRPEAYVNFWYDPAVAAINFRDATLGNVAGSSTLGQWFHEGIAAAPAGDRVVMIARGTTYREAGSNGRFVCYPLPVPENAWLHLPSWTTYSHYTVAGCCVGPDPDHMLVLLAGTDESLNVLRFSDGELSCPMDFDFHKPVAVANSPDGRFILVADSSAECLKTISGADVRGLMDPAFEIDIADVRTFTIPLGEQPAGVVFHPEKNVAYTWSDLDNRIWAVRIGLPGV